MQSARECAAPARRAAAWRGWLAIACLWLGATTAAWAQSALSLPGGMLPSAVEGQPYGALVIATGGAAPYTYSTSDALPPGLSLAVDGTISGTPTAVGNYTFSVDASDSASGSASAVYEIDVLAPPSIQPATLPDATLGAEYVQYLYVIDGSTGPYHFQVTSGSLPPGLALDIGGTLSGTPTSAGTYAFKVSATPAPSLLPQATFPFAVVRDYSITVASPTIDIAPATPSLSAQAYVPYSQAFAASGGTAPYSYAVDVALPDGLALDPSGVLDGTPTRSGTTVLTITATDAYGATGSRTYSLVVQPPDIVLSPATLPDGQVGTAYAQAVSASGGVAPYAYSIASGSLPPGLALDASTGSISGMPTEGGNASFAIVATDANGETGSRDYALAIADAASPPTVAAHHATTPAGTPVQVDLDDGASGGPFTGADVVSVSPAGAGTASIAPDGDGGYALTFAPAQAFSGTATVLYTLSNAAGPSAAGTVAIDVAARPDPLADPEVAGIAQAQATVAQVFAQAQVTNVVDRLERLEEPRAQPWGFWVAGALRRGDLDADGHAEGLAFETSGVTTGADRQLGDSFSFGIAGGLAQDRTLVGRRGSRSDARAHAAVGYGSFHPAQAPFFVNALHGHQRLRFEMRRFVDGGASPAVAAAGGTGVQALASALRPLAAGGDLLDSERTGGQDFSSLGGGYRYKGKAWTFTSYGRQDDVRTTLDPYTEPGGNADALHYDSQGMRTRTSILGFRADGKREIRWGTLLPKFKVEFQRDNDDPGEIAVRYADEPEGTVFRSRPRSRDDSRVAIELGATLVTRRFLTLRLEYHAMLGGLYRNDNALLFSFEKEH